MKTGRKCECCRHPKVQDINAALVMGGSFRYVSVRFGVSAMSAHRHLHFCIPDLARQSKELQAMLSADNLTEKLGRWHERMEEQYRNAVATGNIMAAVSVARTGIAAIESFSRLGVVDDMEQRLLAAIRDAQGDKDNDRDDD